MCSLVTQGRRLRTLFCKEGTNYSIPVLPLAAPTLYGPENPIILEGAEKIFCFEIDCPDATERYIQ